MRPFGISSKRSSVVSEKDMSILLFNGFLLLGFVVATVPDVLVLGSPGATQIMDRDPSVKKCRYNRPYSMLEARCSNLELHEIPTNLKADIQVLDATVNRLRELTNDSLTPYKSLAFIYLADNFIQNIEEAAFANQLYLEVLDLSQNGCDNLPKNLFQLPYLRTLYLGYNKLTDSVFKVKVTSPLKMLQLTKNKLTRIPNLGALPTLINLNVSDNVIVSVSTEDLAPLCSLKTLDLSRNIIRFNLGSCECQMFNAWVKLRQIKIKPDDFYNCTDSLAEDCANMEFSNRTYELYNECSAIIQQEVETEKARSAWILVASCVSVFLFVVFVTLFCVHKRNRRRRRKQKEQQQLTANNANTELLNSNLTAGNS
ncbi:leucine-rich repeats and immunoglobulin-like domains protein sma-10 [Formica exsecta]|uniref:leucine-rich repeats and immunoglobulin-like domains protein sma-10 n=1 Tax=Formica exsecta TaxID=72781 RepID=UPI001141D07D|nr:leucine-rich repeats and immunoglobulin-like domains protein sma-10 [Formica exsecta]XP_029663704.1 leucine-rich repeats and immunoglobulin-like domains protein sma-10 [Formica exsecta]XP_029663705.1 leucine-rich repeats and immunoglobulin-like domains protein sma-10 [Formica exsecta]XP_029663706.1 leucine-rich repeats and immunoglobulin-like domains protein sma-10 [Formica exsecta]XP_029663707.1 leucine-rich repeats and immunoglobulin-like domains protein sma-10 [Formica exsecta]XP_0296637